MNEIKFKCSTVCNSLFDCGIHYCKKSCCTLTHTNCEIINKCPCGAVDLNRTKCTDPISTCDNTCAKQLPCGHSCTLLCHINHCPPCTITTTRNCECGKTSMTTLCANKTVCATKCKKKLTCGKHSCKRICCSLSSHECISPCGKLLDCKSHTCIMEWYISSNTATILARATRVWNPSLLNELATAVLWCSIHQSHAALFCLYALLLALFHALVGTCPILYIHAIMETVHHA